MRFVIRTFQKGCNCVRYQSQLSLKIHQNWARRQNGFTNRRSVNQQFLLKMLILVRRQEKGNVRDRRLSERSEKLWISWGISSWKCLLLHSTGRSMCSQSWTLMICGKSTNMTQRYCVIVNASFYYCLFDGVIITLLYICIAYAHEVLYLGKSWISSFDVSRCLE